MAKNTGTGQYNAGWHELTISKAVDGKWKDKRIIDLNFENYPDNIFLNVLSTRIKCAVYNYWNYFVI